MLDPWLSLFGLAVAMASLATKAPGDPGPHPACPEDMRLVEGVHHERVTHACLAEQTSVKPGEKDTKERARRDAHCFKFAEDLTVLEGPERPIRVCMDQFEAPNRRGARPMVLASFRNAEAWCSKRGRRVCSEREWEFACEGPQHRPLSYGWAVNVRLCNSNKGWKPVDFAKFDGPREIARREAEKLWQGSTSGQYPTCVSPFGIYDLNGNVEEWVASREERRWPGALMGGFWAKPWTGCRGTNDAHQPTFAFYETGFRCCKEPSDAR